MANRMSAGFLRDDTTAALIVSGGGGGAVTQFRPESYGALRDGVTNDTAAIQSAINAAVAAAVANGTFYAEVQFNAGTYLLSSPVTTGGATLGNAQITLPVIVPETSQKVILALLGGGKASAMHWAQTQTLDIGTVLRTTLTGQSSDGTYGAPSVIGGPSVAVGTNPLAPYFSNLHLVVNGITIMAPQNPSLVGMDLRGCANASIIDLATMVRATPATLTGSPGNNGLGVGLMMPSPGNNAVCDIGSYSCEGWNCAITLAEHVVAQRILAVYCDNAVFVNVARHGVSTNHASTIQYLCAEGVNRVIDTDATASIAFALNIDTCDVEVFNTGTHINDTSNMLRGQINWHDFAGTTPRISGAANTRITDTVITRGAFTPSLPLTTVASTPIFRDMALTVTGGTVTAIAVDGVAQLVTAGTVMVPTGKTFTITYSVAPTLRAIKF